MPHRAARLVPPLFCLALAVSACAGTPVAAPGPGPGPGPAPEDQARIESGAAQAAGEAVRDLRDGPPVPPPPRPAEVTRVQPPDLPGDLPIDTPLVCLARAVYFEARGLPPVELSAVAHVALNRRADGEFPDTLCGVVREGGPSAPCQFSWFCDGRSDKARNHAEYAAAVRAAWMALEGLTADPTDGANMFHNDRVRPGWTRSAEDRGWIGAHRFWFLEDR